MPIHVELFGQLQDEPCHYGCGQVHQRAKGEATRSPEGGTVLFYALPSTRALGAVEGCE